MKLKLGLAFLLSISVTSVTSVNAKSEDDFTKSYNQIKGDLEAKIKICRTQNTEIVKKAFTKSKKNIKGEKFEFIKDEKKAITYIEGLDLSKLSTTDEQRFYNLISEQCSKQNLITFEKLDRNRKSCNFIIDESRYMEALLYAEKNYSWSEQTKQKAKSKILEWIKAQANPYHYAAQFVALELLERMVQYGQIDKKYDEEIKQLKAKAISKNEEIKHALGDSKSDKKTKYYSCDGFKINVELEIPFAQSNGEAITALLKKIESH